MDPLHMVLLFVITFIATSISTISGGAGLAVTPVLFLLGVDPLTAVSSYRVGTLGSAITGWFKFHQKNKIDYVVAIPLTVFSLMGAWVGVKVVMSLPGGIIKRIVSVFIIGILAIMLFDKNMGIRRVTVSRIKKMIGAILSFLISIINIIIGGGGGTMYSYILMSMYGQTVLESAGTRKIINGSPIIFASILFLISKVIDPVITLVILTANILAGWFGSEYFLSKGDALVRKVFMTATFVMAIVIFFV